MITDGYSGFDEVVGTNGILRAGCWAHSRRKPEQALDNGAANAAYVLAPIQRLFAVERRLTRRTERMRLDREALVELRRRVRERRSTKLVEIIFARVEELPLQRSTLPKSQLGKALVYLESQRRPLSTFRGPADPDPQQRRGT